MTLGEFFALHERLVESTEPAIRPPEDRRVEHVDRSGRERRKAQRDMRPPVVTPAGREWRSDFARYEYERWELGRQGVDVDHALAVKYPPPPLRVSAAAVVKVRRLFATDLALVDDVDIDEIEREIVGDEDEMRSREKEAERRPTVKRRVLSGRWGP